jgi:hypothetical protein
MCCVVTANFVYDVSDLSTCFTIQVYAMGIAADTKTMLHEPAEIYGLQAQRYDHTLRAVMYMHKPGTDVCCDH